MRFGADRLWKAVAAGLAGAVSGELALGRFRLPVGARTLVMGIVNANDDSFYDRGRHAGTEGATARARALLAAGADIIDVGGQTGQRGEEVPPSLEIDRIRPVVQELASLGVPVSVDTYRAEVADAVLAAGAVLVNDYTGLLGRRAARSRRAPRSRARLRALPRRAALEPLAQLRRLGRRGRVRAARAT